MNMLKTVGGPKGFGIPANLNNNEGIQAMSQSIRQKLKHQLSEQTNEELLKQRALPKVPNAYQGPVITNLDKGKNQPICSNDSHSKATNNGYSRNALGGFFSH